MQKMIQNINLSEIPDFKANDFKKINLKSYDNKKREDIIQKLRNNSEEINESKFYSTKGLMKVIKNLMKFK